MPFQDMHFLSGLENSFLVVQITLYTMIVAILFTWLTSSLRLSDFTGGLVCLLFVFSTCGAYAALRLMHITSGDVSALQVVICCYALQL